jgi:L-ribulose-5-phosphate 3-epimerase UlaE
LYLDIELTPELQQEGLAREMERQVQDLRKKSGLKVGELVDVYYNTQDESLAKALVDGLDRKKTFVNQIQMSLEVEVDYETQAELNGQLIWLGIAKI